MDLSYEEVLLYAIGELRGNLGILLPEQAGDLDAQLTELLDGKETDQLRVVLPQALSAINAFSTAKNFVDSVVREIECGPDRSDDYQPLPGNPLPGSPADIIMICPLPPAGHYTRRARIYGQRMYCWTHPDTRLVPKDKE
jgi:hypothetical protein